MLLQSWIKILGTLSLSLGNCLLTYFLWVKQITAPFVSTIAGKCTWTMHKHEAYQTGTRRLQTSEKIPFWDNCLDLLGLSQSSKFWEIQRNLAKAPRLIWWFSWWLSTCGSSHIFQTLPGSPALLCIRTCTAPED